MAYKYQYNPAATDNVSLHDTARGRTAGSLTYRSSARSVKVSTSCTFHNNNHRRHYLAQGYPLKDSQSSDLVIFH